MTFVFAFTPTYLTLLLCDSILQRRQLLYFFLLIEMFFFLNIISSFRFSFIKIFLQIFFYQNILTDFLFYEYTSISGFHIYVILRLLGFFLIFLIQLCFFMNKCGEFAYGYRFSSKYMHYSLQISNSFLCYNFQVKPSGLYLKL